MIKTVYLIVSIGFFILFATKIFIHFFLDYKNDYKVRYSTFLSIEYTLPYNKVVDKRYESLKIICNIIYKLSILFFCLMLIVLLQMNFARRTIRN